MLDGESMNILSQKKKQQIYNSSQAIIYTLRSKDTPRIRCVPVSDMCRVRHRHDTNTYNYIELLNHVIFSNY
jgi:hypothetical protein